MGNGPLRSRKQLPERTARADSAGNGYRRRRDRLQRSPEGPTIIDMGSITVRLSEQPASDSTGWKTFTGNIVSS